MRDSSLGGGLALDRPAGPGAARGGTHEAPAVDRRRRIRTGPRSDPLTERRRQPVHRRHRRRRSGTTRWRRPGCGVGGGPSAGIVTAAAAPGRFGGPGRPAGPRRGDPWSSRDPGRWGRPRFARRSRAATARPSGGGGGDGSGGSDASTTGGPRGSSSSFRRAGNTTPLRSRRPSDRNGGSTSWSSPKVRSPPSIGRKNGTSPGSPTSASSTSLAVNGAARTRGSRGRRNVARRLPACRPAPPPGSHHGPARPGSRFTAASPVSATTNSTCPASAPFARSASSAVDVGARPRSSPPRRRRAGLLQQVAPARRARSRRCAA